MLRHLKLVQKTKTEGMNPDFVQLLWHSQNSYVTSWVDSPHSESSMCAPIAAPQLDGRHLALQYRVILQVTTIYHVRDQFAVSILRYLHNCGTYIGCISYTIEVLYTSVWGFSYTRGIYKLCILHNYITYYTFIPVECLYTDYITQILDKVWRYSTLHMYHTNLPGLLTASSYLAR